MARARPVPEPMPPLPPDTIAHLQRSWCDVEPIAPRVVARFYDNLFTTDPSLVPLFEQGGAGTMDEQGARLVALLTVAVHRLGTPDALTPILWSLGRQHADHGIEPRHYEVAGEALVETLAQCLGDRFTPAIAAAWAAAYASMVGEMMAARVPPAPPTPVRKLRQMLGWLSLIPRRAV